MLPTGPLMIEHRVIERMIRLIRDEASALRVTKKPDAAFIDAAVDFIQGYADETHHGKEENILFRELEKKKLSPDHQAQLEGLISDHKAGRRAAAELNDARKRYFDGQLNALDTIIERMVFLTVLYPKHIQKEDKQFFVAAMKYFTPEEQEALWEEGHAFDRKMIHKKYDRIVGELESKRDIPPPRRQQNWLEYL